MGRDTRLPTMLLCVTRILRDQPRHQFRLIRDDESLDTQTSAERTVKTDQAW